MKQVRLTKGLYALVDDEDFDFVNQFTWYASLESRGTKFYAVRREKGVKYRMHVEILKNRGFVIPPGKVVDHANHNSLDNRYWDRDRNAFQLEIITQAENMQRSPGWKKKGVKHGPHRKTG